MVKTCDASRGQLDDPASGAEAPGVLCAMDRVVIWVVMIARVLLGSLNTLLSRGNLRRGFRSESGSVGRVFRKVGGWTG